MTVCVATICDGPFVLGASDRMITAGDVEFEPVQPKIIPITNSITVMTAGDSAMHSEIYNKLRVEVQKTLKAKPEDWLNVKDIADLYAFYYGRIRSQLSEQIILYPLGLDLNTFVTKQKEMDSELVGQLSSELISFEGPRIQAIVAGLDSTGAHIYLVDNSQVQCQDAVGFASIGVGGRHANSHFMFNGHTRLKPIPDTLLLTYSSKKRAEVAPGVGKGTDMFVIGTKLGQYSDLTKEILEKLESIYQDIFKKQQKAAENGNKSINTYISDLMKKSIEKTQAVSKNDTVETPPPKAEPQ